MPNLIRSDSDPLPAGSLAAGTQVAGFTKLLDSDQEANDYAALRSKAAKVKGGNRAMDIADQNQPTGEGATRVAGKGLLTADAPEVVVPSKGKNKEPEFQVIDGAALGLDYPLEFPKEWSKSQIRAALKKEFPDFSPGALRAAIPDEGVAAWARAGGLATRSTITALTGMPVMAGNVLTGTVNDVVNGFNRITGQDVGMPFKQSTGQFVQNTLSSLGFPEPETPKEQFIGAAETGLIGAATGQFGLSRLGSPGVGNPMRGAPGQAATRPATPPPPVQGPVLSQLSAGPVQQAVAGTTGALAAEGAGQLTNNNKWATAAGGVVGGALPLVPRQIANAGRAAPYVGMETPADKFRNLANEVRETDPAKAAAYDAQAKDASGMSGAGVMDYRRGLMQKNQADFKNAGITNPSGGQITEGPVLQSADAVYSKIPGSADIYKRQGMTQQSQMGDMVEALADRLQQKGITPAKASRIIDEGLRGDTEGWHDRWTAVKTNAFGKAKPLLGPDADGLPTNTMDILTRATTIDPRMPASSARAVNPEIKQILDDLKSDLGIAPAGAAGGPPTTFTSGGKTYPIGSGVAGRQLAAGQAGQPPASNGRVPYDSLLALRENIGKKLHSPSMDGNRDKGLLDGVYKAMTKDLELMALEADVNAGRTTGPNATLIVEAHKRGQPITDEQMEIAKKDGGPAMRALDRANNITRAGYVRIREVLDQARGPGSEIFDYAVNQKELKSGNRIARIMRSLNPMQRDAVKAEVIQNMGRATPGRQSDVGDVWSSNTFLTNWNRMGNKRQGEVAKDVLFAGMDGELRAALDNLAHVSNKLEQGASVFANPSGTARATEAIGMGKGLGGALLTGALGTAGIMLAGLATRRISARMMFDKDFVNGVAAAIQKPSAGIPAQLEIIAQQYAKDDPEKRREVAAYVSAVKANMHAIQSLQNEVPSVTPKQFLLKNAPQ
jgi:hypothetical protein